MAQPQRTLGASPSAGQRGLALELRNVTISYGGVTAVHDANLDIAGGTFFTLLGPSGCGKTTLLRTIAGFIRQSAGDIRLGGELINDLPAHKRDTGMVFQNYAIFPHLSVEDNVAYGLKARHVDAEEAKSRISAALEMVDLIGYEKRLPKNLSGGQQQRVVIARAIAVRPRVLLMDEPLANLDAKLRVRLRNDLKELQSALGITCVYVTHDQEEALSLSDSIAVMSQGRVEQVGTPVEVYGTPTNLNVANFIGEGNFHHAQLDRRDGRAVVTLIGGQTLAAGDGLSVPAGDIWLGFRPQEVDLVPPERAGSEENVIRGTVIRALYFGSNVQIKVQIAEQNDVYVQARVSDLREIPAAGDLIGVHIKPQNLMVFPGEDVAKDEL